MSKHIELLNKMSAKQKIALLANVHHLADDEYVALGLPRVKFTTLEELFMKDGDGLTPYTLARSWDTDLITKVTAEIIQRNSDDANVIIVPSPKNSFGGEGQLVLSEDPLLATEISLAFLAAVKQCKKIGALSDFCLTRKEVENMDIQPDKKVLNDFFYRPFSCVAKKGNVQFIIGSISKNEGEYENFNKDLLKCKSKLFSPETTMLCLCKTYDETLLALEEDCIIFNGVEVAIQNAYDQYLSILSAVEKGQASMISLEEALEHKTALSDQTLNLAVEKVLDFALQIQELDLAMNPPSPPAEPQDEAPTDEAIKPASDDVSEAPLNAPTTEAVADAPSELASETEQPVVEQEPIPSRSIEDEESVVHAIEKSTVLLKNKNDTLPVHRSKTFAILGDVALMTQKDETLSFADYLTRYSVCRCLGTERGYELLEDRSDDLIPPAVALAKQAAVVFVFLKPREVQNANYLCTSLPANQLALLAALAAHQCNVVAILDSDTNVGLPFAAKVDGFVLAPIAGKLSARALSNVLFGERAMGGKLTTSFHVSPDTFHKKQRFYKNNHRNKIGPFVGYRFYDTQDVSIPFSFGFGLKYSEIEISNETWSASRNLSFSVYNNGRHDIDETIEVYSSMESSNLLRPKKELRAFHTLHIKAGCTERVTINNFDFTTYDDNTQANVVEDGEYTLYIGSSLSTIYKTILVTIHGKTISTTPPLLSDYLQSKSNIISNNFTLEAQHNSMANYKNLKYAGFVCLAISVLIGLMSISAKSPLVPLIIAGIILLGSIALFIVSNNLKNRVKLEEAELLEKNKQLFEKADITEAEQLENLFLEEFLVDATDSLVTTEEEDELNANSAMGAFNEDMSFALAATDLKKFSEESGVVFDNHCAESIIAAFVSSKLIFAKTSDVETFDAFLGAVTNYFGAKLFTETVTEAHNPNDRLLRVTLNDGASVSTPVLNALISAQENPQLIHIIQLKNLPSAKVSEYLIPYVKYFSNPHSKAEISTKGSDTLYEIPSNVWFVVELEKGTLVEDIPAYMLEYATVLPVKHVLGTPAETKTEFTPITMTDFELLTERCRSKFMLNEDVWKKIDTIEAFTYKYASYKIGNKLWLKIETFLAVLLSMETEQAIAIDCTLACVIIPTLAASLAGKLANTDKTLIDEIERVFGEDNVQLSHEMLVSKA